MRIVDLESARDRLRLELELGGSTWMVTRAEAELLAAAAELALQAHESVTEFEDGALDMAEALDAVGFGEALEQWHEENGQ